MAWESQTKVMYAEFMKQLRRFLLESGIATSLTLRGASDSEIGALENRLSLRLPRAVSACLGVMGHSQGGLFTGQAFGLAAFDGAIEVAYSLTGKPESPWRLPPRTLPFLQHGGQTFLFLPTDASEDPPVWLYARQEPAPTSVSLSFTGWLRETALQIIERDLYQQEFSVELQKYQPDWPQRKALLESYDLEAGRLRSELTARVLYADQQRRQITGPLEFQELWNREFAGTELYRTLVREGKRIPWGWTNPAP